MKIIIHRGTHEIGGSCVEVKSGNSRIIVDFGLPLVTADRKPFDTGVLEGKTIGQLKELGILPNINGLYKDEPPTIDAILLSHSHLDHYGLLKYIHPNIPLYLSEGAKALIEISDIFIPHKTGNLNTRILPKWKQMGINDFAVTAYLVDHSAFDALAFLIEADGKRLFYSGDFRGHGRKSMLFTRMISDPPKNIDWLLLEGTMLGRGNQLHKTEEDVQKAVEKLLNGKSNINFLFASSQNIDRLVSAYKACTNTGTTFVIDLYTAYILERINAITPSIPRFNWGNIRVKFFKYHADRLAKIDKKLLLKFNSRKIEFPELNSDKDKFLILARDNSLFNIMLRHIKNSNNSIIIYSMWEGYLTEEFRKKCEKNGIAIKMVHTGGHAIISDLKKFTEAIKPKTLIPIHTFNPEEYNQIYSGTKILYDGEEYNI